MAEPLSPERLAEIREWRDELGKSTSADGVGPYNAIRDLLAEVERLNGETERLTLERDWLDTQLRAARRTSRRHETEKVELGKSLTTQVAEVERLRAENAEQARVLVSAGPEIKRLTERIVELETRLKPRKRARTDTEYAHGDGRVKCLDCGWVSRWFSQDREYGAFRSASDLHECGVDRPFRNEGGAS